MKIIDKHELTYLLGKCIACTWRWKLSIVCIQFSKFLSKKLRRHNCYMFEGLGVQMCAQNPRCPAG